MKKRFLLTAILMSMSLLSSCGNEKGKLVNLTFGKLYDESLAEKVEEHTVSITHSKLSSLVSENKEFILFVYDKNNTCTCYEDFEKAALYFIEHKNALVYGISPDEFDGGHNTFGLNIAKNEETVAIFEDGKIVHQNTTKGEDDPFLDQFTFTSWFNDKVHFSEMLYVTYDQLLGLFDTPYEFTVGFLRSSCPDCAYVEDNVLSSFNAKEYYNRNRSFVIDCDVEGIRLKNGVYDEESWTNFKNRFGLTSTPSSIYGSDYGYGQGFVPSFYTYDGSLSHDEDVWVVDGVVYLNDTLEKDAVNGGYYVADSYYTEERKPLLKFLNNNVNAVIKGVKVPEQDVENGVWKKSAAAKYHDPLLEAFLHWYTVMSSSRRIKVS